MKLVHLVLSALLVFFVAACGSTESDERIVLGGTATKKTMLDRPWGEVPAPPALAKAEPPNEADVNLVIAMIPHHEQAIELATNVLTHEKLDERTAASARFIRQDQKNEISTMKAWLEAWESSLGKLKHSDPDHIDMPGMVDPAKVAELTTLPANQSEISFLKLMVEHHMGAVEMSQDYLADAENTFVLSTARHIISEQNTEITYLKRLADELCKKDAKNPQCT